MTQNNAAFFLLKKWCPQGHHLNHEHLVHSKSTQLDHNKFNDECQ